MSCSKEETEITCNGTTPTYDADIKAIIDATCMGSSCHSTGSAQPHLTSYAGLKVVTTSGTFETNILINKTMPRTGSLTADELSMIKCWHENGYPEK